MQGKQVERPSTAIRMFALCDAMKWSHLPMAGGLYDQHPDLLDKFRYIFSKRSEWQEQERKREERKRNSKTPPASRGRY